MTMPAELFLGIGSVLDARHPGERGQAGRRCRGYGGYAPLSGDGHALGHPLGPRLRARRRLLGLPDDVAWVIRRCWSIDAGTLTGVPDRLHAAFRERRNGAWAEVAQRRASP